MRDTTSCDKDRLKNRFLLKKTSEAEDPGLLANEAVENRDGAGPDGVPDALALERHRAVLAEPLVDPVHLEPARKKMKRRRRAASAPRRIGVDCRRGPRTKGSDQQPLSCTRGG